MQKDRLPSHAVYTIGHSTRPIDEFIGMLRAFGIAVLVDIRTIAGSRHNPQFGGDALAKSLREAGIDYVYMKGLGGLRHTRADSPNTGWRNKSFRGYADYMQTEDFEKALAELIALSRKRRSAIMCAEAVPWRCHRSLVADALTVRDIPVMHIMSATQASSHKLTRFAQIDGLHITYPPEPGSAEAQGRLEGL